ncbi:MAG: hypothetical protein JHC93_01880, partial [Parachlamydiales bacterium]|nr:hypothetical protein [Parachlamydiales bacterium]
MSYCIGGEAPLIYSTGFKEFNDNAENYPFDEIESIAQHLIMDSLFRKLINKRINVDEVIDEAGNFITRIPYTTESKKRYESTIFLIVESVR